MYITVSVIEYVLSFWEESEQYTKCCLLNITNYKKVFNKKFLSPLYDGCISKVIIEYVDDRLYKVDIYADSIYLIYLDSQEKIIEKFGDELIYKIHIISDLDIYSLSYVLPLSKYNVQVDLSGKVHSSNIIVNSLAELKQVGNKKYGFKDIDLFVFISDSKDVHKILDRLLFMRYLKPDIIESHEVYFDFKSYNNEKDMKAFINYIDKLVTQYSQDSFNNKILNKRDLQYISRTFSWYLDISWFSSSCYSSLSHVNVTNLDVHIIEKLANIKNKYGLIGILNNSDEKIS